MSTKCAHLDQVRKVSPSGKGCKECLETGQRWVALRMCLNCGHVGCCDSSPGRHADQHFHDTSHAVMQSFEPGQDWRWCYVDKAYV
ncbi:MAG TPA: UBP-type zinc finger domain-containing protein [Terriglobales bacterium]